MPLEPLEDYVTPGWIGPERNLDHPFTPAGMIGTRFPAYCKIYHPAVEDLSDAAIIADHWRNFHPPRGHVDFTWSSQMRRLLCGATEASFPWRRVSNRELAERLGVPLTPDFNVESADLPKRYKVNGELFSVPPSIATGERLPLDLAARLVEDLEPFTGEQSCYFYWDLFPPYPANGDMTQRVVHRGRLRDVLETMDLSKNLNDASNRVPDWWWPEDRSWLLDSKYDTFYDLPYLTLVGGPQALIDAIVGDSRLETVEVRPYTPIR